MKILRMNTDKARKCGGGSACDPHTLNEAGKYPVIGASDHAIPLWRPQGRTCHCHRDEEANEGSENDHAKPPKRLPRVARTELRSRVRSTASRSSARRYKPHQRIFQRAVCQQTLTAQSYD